jgi:hypothetical protein
METITVDGIDYKVELLFDGDVINVYDINGNPVASAEYDHGTEEVYYSYYDDEGILDGFSDSSSDLFHNFAPLQVAQWLCATHPEN